MQTAPIPGDYALPAGSILHDSYRIEQLLGKGGFAIIYQATELSTGNIVAIKEYFPSNLAKREYEQDLFFVQPLSVSIREFESGHAHFLEEARILKECRDLPGIVQVYDFFEEHQTAYIILEYIDGPTLEQYVSANGVISAAELFELFLPLLHSLKQVHEKGLIHRDISPDNLILGMDNRLYLIDFGAAKEPLYDQSGNHTIILKNGYAPPEQYQASGNIGTWSDIYALCATMYFALSAHAPVSALERLQNQPFIPLSARISISPHIAGVIERGLSLNPADRYKTAESLHYAFMHPEDSEQNHTVIDLSAPEKTTPFNKRFLSSRHILPLLTLLLLLLLGCGIFFGRSLPRRSEPSVQSVESSPNTASAAPEPAAVLTMENVIGLTTKNAKKRINHLDPALQIKTRKAHTDTPRGHVCDQSIAEGTTFYAGSITSITLTISQGSKKKVTKISAHPVQTQKVTTERPKNTPIHTKTPKPPKTAKGKKQDKDFQIITKPKNNSFEIE